MKSKNSIKTAGSFSFFLFLLHVPFYWIFDWKNTLYCLDVHNWAIFMCLNIITIFLLLLFSYLSFFQTNELSSSKIGRIMLLFFSWFYFFRIVAEFLFFESSIIESVVIVVVCLIPAILYLLPVISKKI
jgi:hypothetical protein